MRNRAGAWLNGQNSYIHVPNNAILNPGSDDFTIAWRGKLVKPVSFMVAKSYIGDTQGGFFLYLRGNRKAQFGIVINESEYYTVDGNNVIDEDIHCVVGVKKDSLMQLFVDGIKVATLEIPNAVDITGDNDLLIGRWGGFYMYDVMQITAFWKRALNPDEIAGMTKDIFPPEPVFLFDFRLGHANDLSGNGFDGTPVNVEFVGTTPREVG